MNIYVIKQVEENVGRRSQVVALCVQCKILSTIWCLKFFINKIWGGGILSWPISPSCCYLISLLPFPVKVLKNWSERLSLCVPSFLLLTPIKFLPQWTTGMSLTKLASDFHCRKLNSHLSVPSLAQSVSCRIWLLLAPYKTSFPWFQNGTLSSISSYFFSQLCWSLLVDPAS